MRLIDADALMDKVEVIETKSESEIADKYSKLKEAQLSGMAHISQLIIDAPTVDAVEVVRCKDCRHLDEDNYCRIWGDYMADHGFCSGAERNDPK